MSVLAPSRPPVSESTDDRWNNGAIIISDTHFGDLENGQRESVVGLVHDAVRLAVNKRVGIIWDGDTWDHYRYSSEEKRYEDSAVMREVLPGFAEEGLPQAWVRGNHDPRISMEDIERYTGLSADQYTLEKDFFMPVPECLVTHGHKVQLLNISKLTRRFHKQLASEFGENWHELPPSEGLKIRVLELLNQDAELQKESDKIDEYYQNGIDHPEKRWRTRWAHGLAMFFQSTRGWMSAGLGRLSKHLSDPEGSEMQKQILQWIASGCRLGLTHRALRFAKSLNIPIIVCGHNHVPQVEEEDLYGKHGTSRHLYANAGSAYQRGQLNTLIHLERTDMQTTVHLLEHRLEQGGFDELDFGVYDREKQLVTT